MEGMKYIGDGPRMKKSRSFHACGIFNSEEHEGRPLIVVAGSFNGSADRTSEYWDFTLSDSEWELCSKFFVCLLFFLFIISFKLFPR